MNKQNLDYILAQLETTPSLSSPSSRDDDDEGSIDFYHEIDAYATDIDEVKYVEMLKRHSIFLDNIEKEIEDTVLENDINRVKQDILELFMYVIPQTQFLNAKVCVLVYQNIKNGVRIDESNIHDCIRYARRIKQQLI